MLNIQTEQRYNEIVENYSDMIFRIAYQYLFNKYDAEDIVQEVFVKLLTKRVIFKDEEHIKSWLIRVTINQCLDYKGYKIKEIAKILKQKQNTINSKLTRARKKLKEIMEVEYE